MINYNIMFEELIEQYPELEVLLNKVKPFISTGMETISFKHARYTLNLSKVDFKLNISNGGPYEFNQSYDNLDDLLLGLVNLYKGMILI